jgi:hypothetical protein
MGKEKSCGIAGYYFHLEPGNSFLAGGELQMYFVFFFLHA